MTYRLLVRPQAAAELAEAVDWHEQRSKGLGSEFLRSVDAAPAQIARNPLQYQVVMGQARRAPLRRFPYSLIYTVFEREVVILACFRGSRDPRRLQGRI